MLKTDISALEKRMDTSVAEIYTAVERVENRVIKWVVAVAGALGLGILRLSPFGRAPDQQHGHHAQSVVAQLPSDARCMCQQRKQQRVDAIEV